MHSFIKKSLLFRNNIQLQAFPIAGIIAFKRSAAKAANKVSPSVNYVHVKRIASIPCGHTSYLPGPLAVAITLEPFDIPARIATILSLSLSLILYLPFPFSLSVSHCTSLCPSHPTVSQRRFRLT